MLLLLSIFIVSYNGPEITKKVMDNGLRVIFIEDHTLPIFAGLVQFDVGSIYERPGITGTSHLLEHMLFKGTKKMGTINYEKEAPIIKEIESLYLRMDRAIDEEKEKIKNKIEELLKRQKEYVIPAEIWRIYAGAGGTWMNAFTGETTTQYFVMLPSNKKEVWAKIESDRFTNPILREFFSERDVVNEERRMYESMAWSVLWTHLMSNSYIAAPVRWSVIGWKSDILHVTPDEVMNYYKTYYVPERCILVLAGDVYPDKDMKMVEKYFGKWDKKDVPLIRLTDEPEQNGIRRAHVNFNASDRLAIGFHGPIYGEREYYASYVLTEALSRGRSSIFTRSLVDNGIASEINAGIEGWEGKAKSLIHITAYPMSKVSFDELENEIFNVLDSLKKTGIKEEDLLRAKSNIKMEMLNRRRYLLWYAIGIGNGERVMGDPEYYRKALNIIETITHDEVMDILNKYILKNKSTIITMGENKV